MDDKVVLGLTEVVTICGNGFTKRVDARIDTGAKSNSIDKKLAETLEIWPGDTTTVVKSSMGKAVRHVVMLDIVIAKKKLKGRFTLADRSNLKYPVLIGRDILVKGFIIDPAKQK